MKKDFDKYHILINKLKKKKKLAVAFSGGIDSTLLAYAAKQAEIDSLLITVTSPFFSKFDKNLTVEISSNLGFNHVLVPHNLDKEVVKNPINRCYYCKKDEAKTWKKIAEKHGYSIIADGCNIDDILDQYRPGILACNEEGVWHPLAESNITKTEIRNISRILGIEIWDRPSNACLASRIQFGEEITIQKLEMIERAEDFLRKISPQIRVRLHKNIARIEVPISQLKTILTIREKIISFMHNLGFVYVTLDLEGYRSGSMNKDIEKRIFDHGYK
jgi:uncharacterized protein